MRKGRALFGVISAVFVLSAAPGAKADGVNIAFEKSKLANGMTVILSEDHTLPTVVVNIAYNVGSRFESKGRSGFAHLFEHLMFMGTRRVPTKYYDAWMEAAGGWNNAFTTEDRTDYFDVAPASATDLLLWMEADRLQDLGPTMTLDKLNAQRDVVRNERRQTSENRPYAKVELILPELLYPDSHPYHHPVIGSHEDLEAATVDDVKQFFATYYDPANASLCVVGDFDKAKTIDAINRYFGSIQSRHAFTDPGAPGFDDTKTTLTSVVRKTVEDHVELPKIIMAWQSPKHFGPGDAELDLLSNALAGGKASRLYKSLVYDQKIAQEVEATQESGAIGSRFVVSVLARPGADLDALERAIDKELDLVRTKPITDEELTRGKNGIETGFVDRLQGVGERAQLLNTYELDVHNPGYADQDLSRYRSATAAGIQSVAAKVLLPNARVVLRVIPAKADAAKGATK